MGPSPVPYLPPRLHAGCSQHSPSVSESLAHPYQAIIRGRRREGGKEGIMSRKRGEGGGRGGEWKER